MKNLIRLACSAMALGVLFSTLTAGAVPPNRLRYLGRYEHQEEADHLMGVEAVMGHFALISSNQGVTLVDLESLTPGGSLNYVDRLEGLDAFTTVTRPDGYVYVNIRQGGMAVLYIDPVSLRLSLIREIVRQEEFFEKMSLVGDRLYVAAHAYGIRIYDLSDPATPTLIGGLRSGFDDAFAIAVDGARAYVADGAGGLKIVDLSDETSPTIIAGEAPETAAGTAEDVLVYNGKVYVASGGAGVAMYEGGVLATRTLFDTPRGAKHLARLGHHLAVADMGGLEVFRIKPDGSLILAAYERSQRRSSRVEQQVRIWHGVGGHDSGSILAANWSTLDAYEVVDPAVDDQPDIMAAAQRVRFAPEGGQVSVEIVNAGSATLTLDEVYSTDSSFQVTPPKAIVQPGGSIEIQVNYRGGFPGESQIMVHSNDPDESPLPIQVFGDTPYLDPGELATPFNLESWRMDHETGEYSYGRFDLNSQRGKIVYFRVFGTW